MSFTPDNDTRADRELLTSSSSPGIGAYHTPYTPFTVAKKGKPIPRENSQCLPRANHLAEVRFEDKVTVVPADAHAGRVAAYVLEDPFYVPAGTVIDGPSFVEEPVKLPLGLLAPLSKLSATATNFTPSNLAELNATSVPDVGNYHDLAEVQAIQDHYNLGLANAVRHPRYDDLPVYIYNVNRTATSTKAVRHHASRGPTLVGHDNYTMHAVHGIFTVDQHPAVDDEAITRYILLGNVGAFEFEEEASGQGPLGQVKQVSRRCALFLFFSLFSPFSFPGFKPEWHFSASEHGSGFFQSTSSYISGPFLFLLLFISILQMRLSSILQACFLFLSQVSFRCFHFFR